MAALLMPKNKALQVCEKREILYTISHLHLTRGPSGTSALGTLSLLYKGHLYKGQC